MRKSVFFVLFCLIISFPLTEHHPEASSRISPEPAAPLVIENVGQFDSRALYMLQGSGLTGWITDDGLWLTYFERDQRPARETPPVPPGLGTPSQTAQPDPVRSPNPRAVSLHLTFPDHLAFKLETFGPQETRFNYFSAQGMFSNVPVWHGVRFVGLYPGIDLEISGQDGQWQMQFVATSDTPQTEIPLQIDGADAIRLENGLPTLETPLGHFALPFHSDARLTIHAAAGRSVLNFQPIPSRFPISPLTPTAGNGLVYSTYLGGSDDDTPSAIALGENGEAYVAGETFSAAFPAAPGLHIPTHLVAAFVVKLNAAGTGTDYVLNIISSGLTENVIKDLVVDKAGNAYLTGYTDSADFPTTPGAYDTIPPAATNLYKAFVMKVQPSGAVLYATLLGTNSESEEGRSIAVDGGGNAYVTGYTQSPGFPTTVNAYDQTLGGTRDIFVTQFNATGTALLYSTFLGGTSKDSGERIALDTSNNIVLSGYSEDGPTYPQTTAPLGPGGFWDIVVTKLNPGGAGLLYSTIVGGSSFDFFAQGLALDGSGNAYISGGTYSGDFPTTPGAYDTNLSGPVDTVVFKINSTGTALAFSTYLGGSSPGIAEFIYDLALDGGNRPYLVGYTDSADFPTTIHAYSATLSGPTDLFIAKFNNTGTHLNYATFFGGSLEEYGFSIAVQDSDEFFITGSTSSTNFPTTAGVFDPTYNGG